VIRVCLQLGKREIDLTLHTKGDIPLPGSLLSKSYSVIIAEAGPVAGQYGKGKES
jgi:hypothetical protein